MIKIYFMDRNRMKERISLLSLFIFLLPFSKSYGITRHSATDSTFLANKTINAVRISTPPKIDGKLNEPFWMSLPVAGNFVQYSPRNGTHPFVSTEVRFAFDDEALYIGAIMNDPCPDSICKELGRRDCLEQLNTDYLSIDILPYNDELNMYEFKVSPANLQNDCKYSAIGTDITWDAIWESGTSINDSSWIMEVKIPYAALRLPKKEKQVWGINMWRNFHRRKEYSTWTFVRITDNNIFSYYGKLVGIDSIRPPLRLSFTPYLSGYVEKYPENKSWSYFLRGGLDLRYGLKESFTLDMMLIPDFGQVQSDDQVLNLTPFEIEYTEKRQFFTEATELFDKCGIFYSRRVGSIPKNFSAPYDSATPVEKVSKNPELTRIINATKISGRNTKGLGMGFFNAMTINAWAELRDTVTGESRRIMTQPFTNYNVIVVDQNLKYNSYFSFINTNYYTPDNHYIANVTGGETRLSNKKNTISVFARLNVSQIFREGEKPVIEHNYEISLSKPSGKFQFELMRNEIGDKYDPNDMGFLTNNNLAENILKLYYLTFEPAGNLLSTQSEFVAGYYTLYRPYTFTTLMFEINNSLSFTNFWGNYLEAVIYPLGYYDHYEPREWGWTYKRPMSYEFFWQVSTDTRKLFRLIWEAGVINAPENKNFTYEISLTPRFRFSNRFTVSFTVDYEKNQNDRGWVNTIVDSLMNPVIYFGRRDVITLNTILNLSYIFNTKASVSLRGRHYWSRARNYDFYTLNPEGHLEPSNYWNDHNINFNAFTIDLQFIWYFAPGSELSVVWKNAINTLDNNMNTDYFRDFSQTIRSPQSNSISVRVLYCLEYQNLKRIFNKKKKS